MQCLHILMQELENGIARGEPESFSIYIASRGLAKAVLPFDFVNTLGQKPCTLCAHFT